MGTTQSKAQKVLKRIEGLKKEAKLMLDMQGICNPKTHFTHNIKQGQKSSQAVS
jgi:hypothetical protein